MIKLVLFKLFSTPLAVWFSLLIYSDNTHTSFILNISALLFGFVLAKLVSTTYLSVQDKYK